MSANPQAMAQMLAGQLGQQQQQGGMQAQTSPLGGAAQLAQKIMLMQALQKGPQPQQPQPLGMPPNPTTMGAPGLPGQALPQGMNQAPLPGAVNA
jgi:hypothetical protein